MSDRLNRFLDRLPRTRIGRSHRAAPAFRTCGIMGFYVAVVTLFAGGLLTGRSLTVLALMALVSGLSFFLYTYLRKWITGHEELVLLEHVWFAYACNAGVLALAGLPLLPYLDLFSVALCPFLAAGRLGCTLVGCCHGLPSSIGIRYPAECAEEGFPREWVGLRLFPVPAIEGLGLVLIGVTGLVALPWAVPGRVMAWFLLAYATMRFGLEGIRGDPRPQWLGLSQARWMAMGEVALAMSLGPNPGTVVSTIVAAGLLITLVGSLVYRRHRDPRRRLLSAAHVEEIRAGLRQRLEPLPDGLPAGTPRAFTTTQGVTVAVSAPTNEPDGLAHVSLGLGSRSSDLGMLGDLVGLSVRGLRLESVVWVAGRLHVQAPVRALVEEASDHGLPTGAAIHAAALRRSADGAGDARPGRPLVPSANGAAGRLPAIGPVGRTSVPARTWFLVPEERPEDSFSNRP